MLFNSIDEIRKRVDWHRMPSDPMYSGNDDHYAGVGESALKVIAASHLIASKGEPGSVLDFACATGRVTRWLRAAFPQADLHVSDINPDWLTWSADRFNASGWISGDDLAAVDAPRTFDLIWCGSLVTHVSEREATLLIRKFHDWLTPSGIAVVTTHGSRFIHNLVAGTHKYFSNEESTSMVLSELALKGYGYVAHPGQTHGISVNTVEWLVRTVHQLDARIISVSETAWDNHQDVVAFQKLA